MKYSRRTPSTDRSGQLLLESKLSAGVFCHREDCNGLVSTATTYKCARPGLVTMAQDRIGNDFDSFKENPYTGKFRYLNSLYL